MGHSSRNRRDQNISIRGDAHKDVQLCSQRQDRNKHYPGVGHTSCHRDSAKQVQGAGKQHCTPCGVGIGGRATARAVS